MGKCERRLKSERKGREVRKVPSRSPGSEGKVPGVGGRAALRGPLGPAPRALRVREPLVRHQGSQVSMRMKF